MESTLELLVFHGVFLMYIWGFPKMAVPNNHGLTMGFPTKNDHFGVFWGTTI